VYLLAKRNLRLPFMETFDQPDPVVEGVGDHGCEYMTGGRAIILGETGRNFAAGMSGGIAYVLDESDDFPTLVNLEMVDLEDLCDPQEQQFVRDLVRKHVEYTGSTRGQYVLDEWDRLVSRFVKVMPIDYKRAMQEIKKMEQNQPEGELQGVANG
jgi:glutamate synthase (ferredoxin)